MPIDLDLLVNFFESGAITVLVRDPKESKGVVYDGQLSYEIRIITEMLQTAKAIKSGESPEISVRDLEVYQQTINYATESLTRKYQRDPANAKLMQTLTTIRNHYELKRTDFHRKCIIKGLWGTPIRVLKAQYDDIRGRNPNDTDNITKVKRPYGVH
jgi:hypothetical protein